MTWQAIAGGIALVGLVSGPAVAQTQMVAAAPDADAALGTLSREIARVSSIAGGSVGVSAIHLETGRSVGLNEHDRFPMASVFKVPIAVELLTQVEAGTLSLDRMIDIEPTDLHLGSGTLYALFIQPGVSLSIRNLMELMLRISDNSATDVLLDVVGGGSVVTSRMRALGLMDIDVTRPTMELILDHRGAEMPPPDDWEAVVTFDEAVAAVDAVSELVTDEEAEMARRRYPDDPRDTTTPTDMSRLLEMIWSRRALGEESASLLLDIMDRCLSGQARLKGLLPEGTPVAHKTGSLGGTTNDVGIITLPDGAGHVAISVLVKASDEPTNDRERGIAEVARAVYDFFLFNR